MGVAAVVAAAVVAVGLVAVLWRPLAPPGAAPTTELGTFAPEVLAAVRAYRDPLYLLAAARLALTVVVPLLFVLLPAGRRLVERVAGPSGEAPLRAAAVAAMVAAAVAIARLPVGWYAGYWRERDWGFRTAGLGRWLRDWALDAGITMVAVAIVVAGVAVAMQRWPQTWHLVLVPVGTALAAVVVFVVPILIQPLFLSTRPLPDGPLRDRLAAVLEEAGEQDLQLRVGDASARTTRVNAFVTGLGPTRQVVLYDNLLELPEDQVAVVVAHELAHREHFDVLRGTLATGAALLPLLVVLRWVLHRPDVMELADARSPADPRLVAVALVVVALAQLAGQPVANVVSRRVEAAADHRALVWTDAAAAWIGAARLFVVRDLSDPDPPGWVTALWGSHPAPDRRVAAAVDYAREHDLRLPSIETVRASEEGLRHPAAGPIEVGSDR